MCCVCVCVFVYILPLIHFICAPIIKCISSSYSADRVSASDIVILVWCSKPKRCLPRLSSSLRIASHAYRYICCCLLISLINTHIRRGAHSQRKATASSFQKRQQFIENTEYRIHTRNVYLLISKEESVLDHESWFKGVPPPSPPDAALCIFSDTKSAWWKYYSRKVKIVLLSWRINKPFVEEYTTLYSVSVSI